jgi:hypothetical protein
MTTSDAQAQIRRLRGKKYDPQVVDAFIELVGKVTERSYRPVVNANLLDLAPGMEIAEVVSGTRVLLRDVVLSEAMIEELEEYHGSAEDPLEIRVRARK